MRRWLRLRLCERGRHTPQGQIFFGADLGGDIKQYVAVQACACGMVSTIVDTFRVD